MNTISGHERPRHSDRDVLEKAFEVIKGYRSNVAAGHISKWDLLTALNAVIGVVRRLGIQIEVDPEGDIHDANSQPHDERV